MPSDKPYIMTRLDPDRKAFVEAAAAAETEKASKAAGFPVTVSAGAFAGRAAQDAAEKTLGVTFAKWQKKGGRGPKRRRA